MIIYINESQRSDKMPVKVPDNLPAKRLLEQETIFIMNSSRASHQRYTPAKNLNFESNAA